MFRHPDDRRYALYREVLLWRMRLTVVAVETTMRPLCVGELYATLAYIKNIGCCTTVLLWQIYIAGNNKNVRYCIETKECSFAN